MIVIPTLSSLLVATAVMATPPNECSKVPDPKAAQAVPNDNRRPAGTLEDGVLRIRVVAKPTAWHPEGKDGCGIRVHAFAEEGKPTQIPGPLVRVKVGTQIRMTVRNELGLPLKVRGLFERREERIPDLAAQIAASRELIESTALDIPAGETREVVFRATMPGNFFYWGTTPFDTIDAFPFRQPGAAMPQFSPFEDSQLVGALVVDPAQGTTADRIFVLTHWRMPRSDPDEAGIRQLNGINGLSWPHTESLSAKVGDALQWRVLNLSNAPHTMHLHGFYFRILSQGARSAFDSILAPPEQRTVVSEFMPGGRSITMQWTPERAGNWLFHCHWIAHMSGRQRLERVFDAQPASSTSAHTNHGGHEMAGLVMGIHVKPSGTATLAKASPPTKQLRLYAGERARFFGDEPGLGFVLQEGPNAPAKDSIRIPGTTLVLNKNEPTQIKIFNRLKIPLAVHWHGIELESYFDGVPDFSGAPGRVAPPIAPGDSFTVQMTPPRAGTFFYHIHSEMADELNSGLYGALIVVDPSQPRDAAGDRTFVISAGGRGGRTANQTIFVNGTTKPEPIEMTAGISQRWRFITISANGSFDARLVGDAAPLTWKLIARDGAELPRQQVNEGPAQVRMATGTAYDFEVTPIAEGEFDLQVDLPAGPNAVRGFATRVRVRVRNAAPAPAPEPMASARQVTNRRTLERALELLNDESRWSGYSTPSDLLWSLFCTVQAESPGLASRSRNSCAGLERPPQAMTPAAGTIAEARRLIRQAMER